MTKYKMVITSTTSGKVYYSPYKDTIHELAKSYMYYIDEIRDKVNDTVTIGIYELNNDKYVLNFNLIIYVMKDYNKLRKISNKIKDLDKDFR